MNKSGINVLVIEDDPDICELINIFLSCEGYNVIGVNAGQAALRMVISHHLTLSPLI